MAPRLKVFTTSDGFTDYVVAVSSRPKALAAWGVRQDLFKEGRAQETDDPALAKAARAQPGQVLRRAAGSREALAKVKPRKPVKPGKPVKQGKPPKALLKRIDDLEKRLAKAEAAHAKASARLEAERAALDRREAELRAGYETRRSSLDARLAEARKVLDS
jgi:hypothetical protein